MAVLSCLPEPAGPGDTGSTESLTAPPPHALHRRHRPDSEDEENQENEDTRPSPRAPEAPTTDAAGTLDTATRPAAQPRWEEVRADGVYVLSVDSNSGGGGGGGGGGEAETGGNGDAFTAAPCAELYPWSLVRGADGSKDAPRAPAARRPPRSPERRRQPRCAGTNATTDGGSSSRCEGDRECGGGVGEGGRPGNGTTTGARVVLESGNAEGGGGDAAEAPKLATQEATPKEAARVFEEGGVRPDDGPEAEREIAGRMSPAAAGLLARLRDSIHRRVRTVPYSAIPTTPRVSPVDVMQRCPREKRGNSGGTAATGTHTDSRDGHEEAAQPGAQDEGGVRAAAVGRQGDADRAGLRDASAAAAAAAAAASAETREGSRGGSRSPSERVQTVAAPIASRVGVLFSGGLDSVVLAAMLAEEGGGGRPAVPKGEAIDLINVCFDRCVCVCAAVSLSSPAAAAVGYLSTLLHKRQPQGKLATTTFGTRPSV